MNDCDDYLSDIRKLEAKNKQLKEALKLMLEVLDKAPLINIIKDDLNECRQLLNE